MTKEKLNKEQASFTKQVIDKAFGAHELEAVSKDLDRMFFHYVGTDEFGEAITRLGITETYLSMKKLITGLQKGFQDPLVITIEDPFS